MQGSKNEVPINKESFRINDRPKIESWPGHFSICVMKMRTLQNALLIYTCKYFEFYRLKCLSNTFYSTNKLELSLMLKSLNPLKELHNIEFACKTLRAIFTIPTEPSMIRWKKQISKKNYGK